MIIVIFLTSFKWTDRLCELVKLSVPCCGQILWDSCETYKTFPRCIITEFEYIVDVHEFGWVRSEAQLPLLLGGGAFSPR